MKVCILLVLYNKKGKKIRYILDSRTADKENLPPFLTIAGWPALHEKGSALVKKVACSFSHSVDSHVDPKADLRVCQLVPHTGLKEVSHIAEGHHRRRLHLQPIF